MFEKPHLSTLRKLLAHGLLVFDSFVDSSLYASGQKARRSYIVFAVFMDRFHVEGWRRVLLELSCESISLGIALGLVALVLAQPAFQETSDDWLRKQDLAVTFLDRYGQVVGKRGIKHDDTVAFEDLPKHLIEAVLATEDRRFFEHYGIDFIGTLRALTVNARANTVVQGGSSITQQLAKNLFLSNQRTLERKIKEAFLAVWLEFHLSKREILGLYLDRAYMGGGTFGVQAASEFYFGKSVRDLSLADAAMLAGLFKAPTKYAPHINLPAARARANDVLSNMVDAGYLTEGQVYVARRNPSRPIDRMRESTPDWYLDYAFDEIKKLKDANKLGNDNVLTVKTALDSQLQKFTEATIEDQLRQYGPSYHAKQSAMVIIEPTGALRTIVGGRDYGASQFNRATDALRQPGSSFKPFVYMTALMSGKFKPSTIVLDAPVCIGDWCPNNYGGKYYGHLPLVSALAHSLNTVAVRLSIAIGNGNPKAGRAKIIETARAMGLTTPLIDTVSLPIGAAEVTVMDMASAYTVFANGGQRIAPYSAVEVANSRGEIIYRHDRDAAPPRQIIDPEKIIEMDGMLNQVVEAGTARKAKIEGVDIAGKTGTTNGYKDAWFMGFTGNYVGAIWFGNDDDTSMNNMTGGSLPAATWQLIMAYAHEGIALKPLPGRPLLAQSIGTTGRAVETASSRKPATFSPQGLETLGRIAAAVQSGAKPRPDNMVEKHALAASEPIKAE